MTSAPRSCPHEHDDAAYVLGALPPAERLEFERHLSGCNECTRSVRVLAGLPGLLSRIDPLVLETPVDREPVPDTLLPALVREAHRASRRRMTAAAVLAAAAIAVIAALTVVVLGGRDAPTPSVNPPTAVTETMQQVGDVPVQAQLTLEQVAWGTRLGLACTYDTESVEYELPPEVDYLLVVHTRDGRAEEVGSWRSSDDETATLQAATAADRDEITSVEVRTPDGRVVLRADT